MVGQYKSMNESYKDQNGELDDHLRVFRKQVSEYLGEDYDAFKKNTHHDTFDKMVYLKNDLKDCIEHKIQDNVFIIICKKKQKFVTLKLL